MKLVVVKFHDSTFFNDWAAAEVVDQSKPKTCYAAGWLVEENDNQVKLALMTTQDAGAFADWIVIPTGSVITIDEIKNVDWERNGNGNDTHGLQTS